MTTYMRQRQALQAAAIRAYQVKLAEIAGDDKERLALADAAKERGEIALAATIYLRLGTARRNTESVQAAKKRFIALRADADARLAAIDDRLEQKKSASASSSSQSTAIQEAFEQYRELSRQFGAVPGIGPKLRAQVAKRSRLAEHAVVLNEPEARQLWRMGQKMESQGQTCCAFQIYDEAAKLRPAPSGGFAHERLEALRKDAQAVADAKRCAELQWCHRIYDRADRMATVNPSRAKMLFQQVTTRAPSDSKVGMAAAQRLSTLN